MALRQLSRPSLAELTRRQRIGVLVICCMSLLIVGLDTTIVNVALPSIGRDFHASVSGLQWTVDAYTLVLASFLMLAGATADRAGTPANLPSRPGGVHAGVPPLQPGTRIGTADRLPHDPGRRWLDAEPRGHVDHHQHDRRERAQAVGIWGIAIGVSMALGPIVGGVLVTTIGWRSVFWINIPVGFVAILLTTLFIPESKAPKPRRPDPLAQLLVIVLLASVTFGIIEGPGWGWTSGRILASFAVALASLVGLLFAERRRLEPLIELRFFRSIPFSGATGIAVFAFAAMAGFLLINTLYLQDGRGLSALHAGLATLPMAATWLIFAPVGGRLVGHRGPRLPLVLGGAAIAVTGFMLTAVTNHTPYIELLVAYAVLGLGLGVVNPPITVAAVSGMPVAQAGVASAVASTSRQVGSALGVAVLGAMTTSHELGSLHQSIAAASHNAWWVVVGCGVAVLILGLIVTTARAARTAERVAS